MHTAHTIRIIGAPMDLGASRRGVDMGPFAVRYADVRERLAAMGHTVEDAGNVTVPFREDAERGAQRGARYLGAITDVCWVVITPLPRAPWRAPPPPCARAAKQWD
jgi:arginase